MQWLAIGLGAAFGACLRAWLTRFNLLHSWIPLGTLGANVLGGLLIGLALVWSGLVVAYQIMSACLS